jgi:hypothetical protein
VLRRIKERARTVLSLFAVAMLWCLEMQVWPGCTDLEKFSSDILMQVAECVQRAGDQYMIYQNMYQCKIYSGCIYSIHSFLRSSVPSAVVCALVSGAAASFDIITTAVHVSSDLLRFTHSENGVHSRDLCSI